MEENNLLIYKDKEDNIIVDAFYKDETLWLTQKSMAKVFDVQRPAITKHLNNIFSEKELDKNTVCSKMEHTAEDGKNYQTEFYGLDSIVVDYDDLWEIFIKKFLIWSISISLKLSVKKLF